MICRLFTRLILWLRRFLRIRLDTGHEAEPVPGAIDDKVVTQVGKTESSRISESGDQPTISAPRQERTLEPSSPQITDGAENSKQSPGILELGTLPPPVLEEGIKTADGIAAVGNDILEPPKPPVKKSPTGTTQSGKRQQQRTQSKPGPRPKEKVIYLGGNGKRSGKKRGAHSSTTTLKQQRGIDRTGKDLSISIESPVVEINFDEASVHLVLPQQELETDRKDEPQQYLNYQLELNGKKIQVSAKVVTDKERRMLVETARIPLKEPLLSFAVTFPDELQGRKYKYTHKDKALYAFAAIGNNRGRMYWLYNKDGDKRPLPKRDFWVLVHEDFEMKTAPDVIGEKWIWERYRPFRIDLREIDVLVIRNKTSSSEKNFPLQSTFRIEGKQLIEDDYKKESPLFTDETLNLVAPYENQSGWNIWIQNRLSGSRTKENWKGNEPLILNCPEDLPCDCGEFQIDVCQQGTRIPDETLFFRWMPCLNLDYPRQLIVPDPHSGHIDSIIKIESGSEEFVVKTEGSDEVESMHNNCYQLKLPPERDTMRFSIVKQGKTETVVDLQVTIPRLKWKTSKQDVWDGRFQKIERKDLKSGESFYLLVRTNDLVNKYDLRAVLETNGQILQEGQFVRRGMEYSLELNQFFDTIKANGDELRLKVEVREIDRRFKIGEVCMLSFLPPITRCKLCSFEVHGRGQMIYHFEQCHLEEMIEPVTYDEMREKYDKSLPHRIHKCSYCGFYSRDDDLGNITSSICQHIQEYHPNMRISFKVVSNIDEIRQNVIPDLAHIYKCKLCGIHFKDYDRKAVIGHFLKEHETEIFVTSEG